MAQPFQAAPQPQKGRYGLDMIFKNLVFLLAFWALWVVLDFTGASGGRCKNLV